ncbi:MAG: four helix bundle protein [Acidobacteria bacterium]|nr:MAG: four helix bundle protein [Acidobacteriota bacterium]
MPPDDIGERAFVFACRVLLLCDPLLRRRGVPAKIGGQLADAGSSVGANLEEANGAQSKLDFIAKSSIALKEARESWYWLRVLEATVRPLPPDATPLRHEANELVAILTTIVKNAKARAAGR